MVSKALQVLALANVELYTDQLTTCPFFPLLSPWLWPDLRFTGVSFAWETLHLLLPLPGTLFLHSVTFHILVLGVIFSPSGLQFSLLLWIELCPPPIKFIC